MSDQLIIALVGKVGHGKTLLLNKLTGKRFPSNMGARSCTRTLQFGYTPQNDILVVDTPGFYASEDVAAHIAAQKLALEEQKLSGIFVVLKYARADELAETMNNIMNFIGDGELRIIVTHDDVARGQPGYDPAGTKTRLSEMLDISAENMIVVGKDTHVETLEAFIQSTLHTPKEFKISEEQVASISSLCMGARKFNKAIDEVYAKIAAASRACEESTKSGKSYQADVVIGTVQKYTTDMVQDSKQQIFQDIEDQKLTEQQCNLVYGKAGLALSLRLKAFIDATNRYLSWDVTDPQDLRNVYRKCPFCGAVFNKISGCDGNTICGAVPNSLWRPRPTLLTEFQTCERGWFVQYIWDGTVMSSLQAVLQMIGMIPVVSRGNGSGNHTKRSTAVFESGCGATVCWSTMLPVDPDLLQNLAHVELQHAELHERASKANFVQRLLQHEVSNKRIFGAALAEKKK
jgi:predicted GTPase